MLTITLKINSRTKRVLELDLTEQELGDCRRAYWILSEIHRTESAARKLLDAVLDASMRVIDATMLVRAIRAITTPTLHVGGIYWYHERTPPAQSETRMRAFRDELGHIKCPRCACELHTEDHQEQPVACSKTLNNPRYVCPHCNAYVIVSSRKQDYEDRKNKAGSGIGEL